MFVDVVLVEVAIVEEVVFVDIEQASLKLPYFTHISKNKKKKINILILFTIIWTNLIFIHDITGW